MYHNYYTTIFIVFFISLSFLDSLWKIELTSQSKLTVNVKEIKLSYAVIGSETKSSQGVTLKKLAYLPTFSAFTNIGNISIGEVGISFERNSKSINISKVRIFTFLNSIIAFLF